MENGLLRSSVVFLLEQGPPPRVLLGRKKVRFGAGKYTGIGGKLDAGETPAQCALREVAEETGVRIAPPDLKPMGEVIFLFPCRPAWSQMVYIFTAGNWQGQPAESAEIRPEWFPPAELPLPEMWPDAPHWVPPVLNGQAIRAVITYNDDNETIKEARLEYI